MQFLKKRININLCVELKEQN